MPHPRFRPGEIIAKRYEVHQVHFGGMGVVYICYDQVENIPFVLKTFQDKYLFHPQAKERFVQEATTWVNLGYHPYIVYAERVEIIDGQPYLILECVLDSKGYSNDLARLLTNGPLDTATALRYAIQICLGMNYAVSRIPNFVHRDLKPSNVLINNYGHAKVTDFGLALAARAGEGRQASGPIGTPGYMSPEQSAGLPLDTKSDIYSFGCILYEMLTGKMYSRQRDPLSNKSAIFDRLHPEIVPLLMTCLYPTPEKRYLSFYATGLAIYQIYERIFKEKLKLETRQLIVPGMWAIFQNLSYEEVAKLNIEMDAMLQQEDILPPDALNQANALMDLGKYAEALEIFDRWLKTYGDNKSNMYAQEYLSKLTPNERKEAEERDRQSIASIYINKANALANLDRLNEAFLCFKQVFNLAPSDANAWYNFGEFLFNKKKDVRGAIEAYRKALAIHPDDDWALTSLGFVLSETGAQEEAMQCYDKALAINPRMTIAWANKGVMLYRLGRLPEALQCFQRLTTINPGNALSWYYQGIILDQQGDRRAAAYLERAIQLKPDVPVFRQALEQIKRS